MSQISPMPLTVPHLQSRQSALFPSHTYFCLLSGTPYPGHCLCVFPHLTSHTPHKYHAAVLCFCLSPHAYYPAQLPHLSLVVPGTECYLLLLSLPPLSSLQSLFQVFKSPCARWEDNFLIHPHYQQSVSRSEQPC